MKLEFDGVIHSSRDDESISVGWQQRRCLEKGMIWHAFMEVKHLSASLTMNALWEGVRPSEEVSERQKKKKKRFLEVFYKITVEQIEKERKKKKVTSRYK